MMDSNKSPTSRERICGAFERRLYDRPPVFDVPNNPDLFRDVLGRENFWSDPLLTIRLARELGLDAVMIPCSSYSGMINKAQSWRDDRHFTDRFGIEYVVTDSSWPLGFVSVERRLDEKFLTELETLQALPTDELTPVVRAVSAAHNGKGDELAVFGGLRSGFSFLNIAAGLAGLSMLIYENPELLHRIVRAATGLWTQIGLAMIAEGVDALYVANDMGMNGSTLISPEHLREFFLPYFFEQCAAWKQAGGRIILHSCGNINAILPDLYAAECIDALNNLQAKAGMDIRAVKKKYGGQWVMIGNVDATSVMTTDNPADIDAALDRLFAELGTEGLIVATDHSFHHGVPPANVLHFLNAARRLGHARCGGME